MHNMKRQLHCQRSLLLLRLLLLCLLLCTRLTVCLPNGTLVASLGLGLGLDAAGNVNLPTLGAGIGSMGNNGSSSSSSAASGGANSPVGSGNQQQTNSDASNGIGSNSTGSGAGGSGGGSGLGSAGNNNAALLQLQQQQQQQLGKEKQYDKCTGPGDPGPCKQYIYKWRYEPTTGECTTFIWGGCDGNPQNRFSTEAECLFHCIGAPHTLPPFLQSTTREPSTTESSLASYTQSPAQAAATGYNNMGNMGGMGGVGLGGVASGTTPVPIEQRGPELTFAETGQGKTFVFAKNNTFIQMDGDIIQTFQLRLCREISFQFRTRLPHGLLVYHNVKNPDRINLEPYALYVIVEKGQLKVVHVFGKHSTSVTVGESLNRDEWHSVMVRIDVHGARLIARVDNSQEEVYLKGLNHEYNYGVSTNLPSVVLVGGLSSEEKLHGVKYITESFVGCIRNVVLSSGKAASDLLPIAPLVATKHENVKEGCFDMCDSRHNLCFVGSRCINHFSGISCDCFGTHYEGEHCDIYSE
ncbi:uncharacterized protein LOC117134775 [Drosophila busckii]|uniref:uncharacterized protein LOC117134775 n=1 Tax=Drosophila busckii TaxID=30019 RepID=UPI0014328940|nr:uncharacterized protein LOC117134775 [Drosophila busckii]